VKRKSTRAKKKIKTAASHGKARAMVFVAYFWMVFCPKWLNEMMFVDFFRIKLSSKILGGLLQYFVA